MAHGPPISSRQWPGLLQWLSKYGVVGRLVFEAQGIAASKQTAKEITKMVPTQKLGDTSTTIIEIINSSP